MSFIKENLTILRGILFALLLVAILGPWTYDLINVPAEYLCDAPFIRLEGDYCGVPVLGITAIFWIITGLPHVAVEFISGRIAPADLVSSVLPGSLILLIFLPFLSSILLIRKQDSLPWQLFHILVLVLIVGLGVHVIFPATRLGLHGPLLGMWLYFGLAVFMLVLELLAFVQGRKGQDVPVHRVES